jgi:rhamnulokinase
MPATLTALCHESAQPAPETHGGLIRCALESLALKYRTVLAQLEQIGGRTIDHIHIVGGGAQNRLLGQMAADACARPVLAGPVEATATGNVLMQAIATGDIAGLSEARQIVHRSLGAVEYHPPHEDAWPEAAERLTNKPL